jgi:hypothetical protein
MTVERTHAAYQTRYELRDQRGVRSVLAFDAGETGRGPGMWKILLPGPGGTEDLYGTKHSIGLGSADLTNWLTPIVGQDVAGELAAAVDEDPPPEAG